MLSTNKIKLYRSLQEKKYRDLEGLYIAEGAKMVLEAIKNNSQQISAIICTDAQAEKYSSLLPDKTFITNYSNLKKISSLKTPQEVLAVLNKPIHPVLNFKDIDTLVLALEDIRDPGNMGTIIRLADWFGVKDIICSLQCVDCFNPKSVQATMGSIFRVRIHYLDLPLYLNQLDSKVAKIYGTALDGENIYTQKLQQASIVIMGNESTGLSEDIRKKLNTRLLIPHASTKSDFSESLNVSVATALVLGEFRRQQFYSK